MKALIKISLGIWRSCLGLDIEVEADGMRVQAASLRYHVRRKCSALRRKVAGRLGA